MREMHGSCLCGQVTYSANAEPAFVGVCHCKNCQRHSGTAFALVVGVPSSAMSLLAGYRPIAIPATAVESYYGISVPNADRR